MTPVVVNSERELRAKLSGMGKLDKETRNRVVCSLIGHSRIQTACFGYFNCGRCGAQVGDTLASSYPGAGTAVVVGHACKTCRKNYRACTWKDRLYTPHPFPAKRKKK